MIKIQKDDKVLNVSKGAYNSIYKPSGWHEVNNYTNEDKASENGGYEGTDDNDNSKEINEQADEEKTNGEEINDEKKERKEELKKIPVSSMSQKELKEIATLVGVNIKNKTRFEVEEEVVKALSLEA